VSSSYELEYCSDPERWDDFVSLSPQGNIFCTSKFLNSLKFPADTVFVKRGEKALLGAVLLGAEPDLINPPMRYQGILFPRDPRDDLNHQRVRKNLEAVSYLLSELAQRNGVIRLSLHHSFEDLRSIQWFNFDKPKSARFEVHLRYTGILNLSQPNEFQDLFNSFRTARRQDYKKAQKGGFYCEESCDGGILNYLQEKTYNRQGMRASVPERKLFARLAEKSLGMGFGRLMVCCDKNKNPVSASLFIYDSKCGYYLVGANDPKYRRFGTGTAVLVEQIRICKEQGLAEVDFCGINSPDRGDFKTSFNAVPVPFFEAVWRKR
jgi:hypothetical protein